MNVRTENHQSFLERFSLKLRPRDIRRLDFAYDISKYSHRGQVRENGERYFEHCRAATLILFDELEVLDPDILVAELLHDSVEDSFLMTIPRIRMIFGHRVSTIVDDMTKRKGESVEQYVDRLAQSEIESKIAKFGDRIHNLRTIKACSPEKVKRKIEETDIHYIPLLDDVLRRFPHIGRSIHALLWEAMWRANAESQDLSN